MIYHTVEGKNIGASEPPSGGRFFCCCFTVFILFGGLGVVLCFCCVFWCVLVFLILFLDSSRFSASIASIFVEKY